jgi:hypothetical protein
MRIGRTYLGKRVSLSRWIELCLASDEKSWSLREIAESYEIFYGVRKEPKCFSRASAYLQQGYSQAPWGIKESFASDPEMHAAFPEGPPRIVKLERRGSIRFDRTRFQFQMMKWRIFIMRLQLQDFQRRTGRRITRPE